MKSLISSNVCAHPTALHLPIVDLGYVRQQATEYNVCHLTLLAYGGRASDR